MEAEIQELSIPPLKKLAKPEDFVLIKTNKSGYSNVRAKVYENSCKVASFLKDGQNSIPLKGLVNEEWYSLCVLYIKRLFMRGLVGEIKSKLSLSDDYSDED